MTKLIFVILILTSAVESRAEGQPCAEMEVWDVTQQMCMPFPMPEMPMTMLMLHGYGFGTRIWQQGPRGRDAYAGPSMVMADLGKSIGDRHYLNLEFMGTADKWTFPDRGYPLFGQIGEEDAQGNPFIDAQHPHSSPVMGLTLSDTISLASGKDNLKVFFAPRGESTDGPIPFMHRPTGTVNPDAPLGHHIGQDVGHITSTVIGGSLQLGDMHYELSTFHGAEPKPENVDLPQGNPNSMSFRLIREFSAHLTAMASFAYVKQPEPNEPDIGYELRYSASAFHECPLTNGWSFNNALIFGAVTQYDHSPVLYSLAEEFLFQSVHPSLWGRIEAVQRTPQELNIGLAQTPSLNPGARWMGAATLGYTHLVATIDVVGVGIGGSVTKTLMPGDFVGAYGGDPWSGKVFIRMGGMKMWDL